MNLLGRTLVAVGVVAGLAVAVWQVGVGLTDEPSSAQHLVNRLWIERKPTDPRDMVGKFVVLRSDRGRLGAVGRSSVWRHFYEVFKWSQEEERLTLVFPQARARTEFRVRTWSCGGEAPKPFDLCLELKKGERSVQFYSRESWVVRPQSLAQDLEALGERAPADLAPAMFDFTVDDNAEGQFAEAPVTALPPPLGSRP